MLHPDTDGINHINVYSNGKTLEGRFFTNFARSTFTCEDGKFSSIEGYWYWLSVPAAEPRRDELRLSYGFQAKKLGRELRGTDWVGTPEFEGKILRAIDAKLASASYDVKNAARNSKHLPLRHYYVFGEGPRAKIHADGKSDWMLKHIDKWRQAL
jgi:hypothetical protein